MFEKWPTSNGAVVGAQPHGGDVPAGGAPNLKQALRGADFGAGTNLLRPSEPGGGASMASGGELGAGAGIAASALAADGIRSSSQARGAGSSCEPGLDRLRALQVLASLTTAMHTRHLGVAQNYVENIRRYVAETGGDGSVVCARPTFEGMAMKSVVSSTFTTPAGIGLEALIKPIIRQIGANPVQHVLKAGNALVIGVLFDVLVERLFDPTGKALRAAFRAGVEQGASLVAAAAQTAIGTATLASAGVNTLTQLMQASIMNAQTAADLDALTEWMAQQIPGLVTPHVDTSLYEGLLEQWVLQRAGDEEDANKDTDPEAYAKAQARFAPSGNLARKDLFVHQCELALARFGIDTGAPVQMMRARLEVLPPETEPEDIATTLTPLRFSFERFARPGALVRALADAHALGLDSHLVAGADIAPGQVPDHAFGHVGRVIDAVGVEGRDKRTSFEALAATGGLRLGVDAVLTSADGAVFVDEYRFSLAGTRHDAEGKPRLRNAEPHVAPIRWEESPD